jgi:hypothetical protein
MTATFTHMRDSALRHRLLLEISGKTTKGESTLAKLRAEGITSARTRKQALADLEKRIVDRCSRHGLKSPVWAE